GGICRRERCIHEDINTYVLVHGEHNEMGRLKAAIIREYKDKVGHFECFYV
ncbi:Hypothetical predicted protein, partial [Paramuricea clavata]